MADIKHLLQQVTGLHLPSRAMASGSRRCAGRALAAPKSALPASFVARTRRICSCSSCSQASSLLGPSLSAAPDPDSADGAAGGGSSASGLSWCCLLRKMTRMPAMVKNASTPHSAWMLKATLSVHQCQPFHRIYDCTQRHTSACMFLAWPDWVCWKVQK